MMLLNFPPVPRITPIPDDPTIWWDPYETMARQAAEWTCSACSLAWVERSSGVNPAAYEWSAVNEIGYDNNINQTWGLMDGSGSQLARVLRSYGLTVTQVDYPSFDQICEYSKTSLGAMGGANWYHWVAIRGYTDEHPGILFIANSAPGYKGIQNSLTREQYNSLGGFRCLIVDR